MGLLSSNVSITRYQVLGQLAEPLMDTLTRLLTQNAIVEIDDEDMDQSAGWTSFEDPFTPDVYRIYLCDGISIHFFFSNG